MRRPRPAVCRSVRLTLDRTRSAVSAGCACNYIWPRKAGAIARKLADVDRRTIHTERHTSGMLVGVDTTTSTGPAVLIGRRRANGDCSRPHRDAAQNRPQHRPCSGRAWRGHISCKPPPPRCGERSLAQIHRHPVCFPLQRRAPGSIDKERGLQSCAPPFSVTLQDCAFLCSLNCHLRRMGTSVRR